MSLLNPKDIDAEVREDVCDEMAETEGQRIDEHDPNRQEADIKSQIQSNAANEAELSPSQNNILEEMVVELQIKSKAKSTDDDLARQICELEDVVRQLQAENAALAKGRQEAWHLGYQAGLQEAENALINKQDDTISSDTYLDTSTDKAFSPLPTASFYEDVGSDKEDLEEPWEEYLGPQTNSFTISPSELETNDFSTFATCQSDQFRCEDKETNETVGQPFSDYTGEESLGAIDCPEGTSSLDEVEPKSVPIDEDELRDLLKFRFGRPLEDAPSKDEESKKPAGTKFVGAHRPPQDPPKADFIIRNIPPDIRKACLVLGLRPEEITREIVHKSWKKEMTNPGTHPDVGGETEIAVYINTAKDTLYRWLDAQAPKLGKKFGSAAVKEQTKSQDKPDPENDSSHDHLSENDTGAT